MRDRRTTRTTLAHVDSLTDSYFTPFDSYLPQYTDVYIIGGNPSRKHQVNEILTTLKERNFEIKFAHIIDDGTNSFVINCISGDTYLNADINPQEDLPLVFDAEMRNSAMLSLSFTLHKTKLRKVNIE